eukprot:5538558-Pyramimonas_sp.AAC.1
MRLPATTAELDDLIDKIDIPPWLRPVLTQNLQRPEDTAYKIGDERNCEMIPDHRASIWMAAREATHYQVPTTGTRPGVPFSD